MGDNGQDMYKIGHGDRRGTWILRAMNGQFSNTKTQCQQHIKGLLRETATFNAYHSKVWKAPAHC